MSVISSPPEGEGVVVAEGDTMPSPPPKESGHIQEVIRPKIYLNGFPKSGLHLSMLMALCVVEKQAHENPWAGTFKRNGWSSEWMPDWRIYKHLSRIRDNGFMKGHSGYRDDIALFLKQMGAAVAFVYRDLRDVAVSMSYHVIHDDDKNFTHPDKDLYRALDSHEDVIAACIKGIGPYAPLVKRWEDYSGWLSVDWVIKLPYEEMRNNQLETAKRFVREVYDRTGEANGLNVTLDETALEKAGGYMVDAMNQTHLSPTFRKGKAGGWREHFTPRLKQMFHEEGLSDWLIGLGYEHDYDW